MIVYAFIFTGVVYRHFIGIYLDMCFRPIV